MDDGMATDPIDIEWEKRTLCKDESCIGVIGEDGRCKECGLVHDGVAPANSDTADEPVLETAPAAASEGEPNASPPFNDDWENRTLCADGNCIGVIGPDGLCKECGKPYSETG